MRAAFAEIVDYAGLYPPAAATMADAVQAYARYRQSPDRWMLGRFIVGAARLSEFTDVVRTSGIELTPRDPWTLSVVLSDALDADVASVEGIEAAWRPRGVIIDAVEAKATDVASVVRVAGAVPKRLQTFLEVPQAGPYRDLVQAMVDAEVFGKIRTGGTTPELFPASRDVIDFLQTAVKLRLPFKATAGLHHPFRGEFPITYAADAPRQLMYGFVNLLLATTDLSLRDDTIMAQAILDERDAARFVRRANGYRWRDRDFPLAAIAAVRARFFLSFGSCSFREPVDELGVGAAA